MKISKIHIKNLNSLRGEQVIDFMASPLKDTGLFAITGDTGAGKTTILDAITLALYGRVHRNKEVREVLSFGATECFAEVEFSSQGKKYRAKWALWRARNKADGNILGPARELACWEEEKEQFEIMADKIREVDQWIEKVSGLDFDRFSRSVLLSQGDFAAFLKANEKERSDLLERITGTEIYSQLSQAAFQRHKIEKEKLEQFQQQQESLRLLDKDLIKEKKEAKKEYEKESKQKKKELDEVRSQLQNWSRQEALILKQEQLETGIQQLKEQQETLRGDFAALDQHLKTQNFVPTLQRLDDEQANFHKQNTELQSIRQQIIQYQQEELASQAALKLATENWQNAKKEQQELHPKIEKAQALDVEIREKENPILQREEEWKVKKENKAAAEIALQKLQEEQSALQKRESELQHWLKENQRAQLQKDLAALVELHKRIEVYIVEGKEAGQELKKEEKLLKKEIKEQEKTESQLAKKQGLWTKTEEAFKTALPENYVRNPEEVLRLLHSEIENLSDQRNNLQQFHNLYDDYQILIREQLQDEEKLENLRNAEYRLNTEVLTSLEMVDSLSELLEFKQQTFEQQQLIANYERDRSELKAGMPCPICQSTEHPFRHQHFKPFLNHAREEYQAVRQQHEQVLSKQRQLMREQEQIAQEIENLVGKDNRELGGQIQTQLLKILAYENKIAGIIPILPNQDLTQKGNQYIQKQIASFNADLERKKKQRTQLTKLKDQLQSEEKLLLALKDLQKDQQRAIDSRQVLIKISQDKIAKHREDYQQAESQFNQVVAAYGIQFDHGKGSQQIADLEKQLEEWEANTKELLQAGEQIRMYQHQIKQARQQQSLLAKEIQKLNLQIEKGRADIAQLKKQRQELLAGDPLDEKERLQQLLHSTEAQKEQEQKTLETIAAHLKTSQGQEKALEKTGLKQSEALKKIKTELLSKILAAGFQDLEQIRAVQLTKEQTSNIQLQKEQLQKNRLQQEQSLQDTQADLQQLLKALKDQPEQAALLTQQNQLDQSYRDLLQNIGGLEVELKHQKELEGEAKQLLEQIEGQRREFNRWAKLHDLIGSSDGKKFRVFAQGLTLKKLCLLANKHLRNLDGRYWIEKRGEQDLELDIIDTYQADNRRSMNTLSGGESFLVSLALALGLSDLAGRNTLIQSLFIDEGFGSLDDVSLDLAITTLENLQAGGKTIGVISHVNELKERIATQIRVKKNGSGFSQVQIV